MIATLLRKELRQHRLALLSLAILTLAGWAILFVHGLVMADAGSTFDSVRRFLMFLVPLTCLVLCHRLVVAEYAAKTQLFLDALPVSRWRMVAVKYLLGLAFVVGIVAVTLALAAVAGARHEALTPRFIAILAARALSAAVAVYGFFFLTGFLGRYRLALYIAILFIVIEVDQSTSLEWGRFGPLALLDDRFAYESRQFPWEALRATWALGFVTTLLAFALGLVREGNAAALLAQKMSHRERIFVAVLLLGVAATFAILDERREPAPFDLHGAVMEQRAGVVVKVAGDEPGREEARRLAAYVADELAGASAYLGLPELPPVFIARRRDLDPDRFERGELKEASGVLVQANFGATAFRRSDFTTWLLRETLIVRTRGRAKLEPKMWVLDGFAPYWGARAHLDQPLAAERTLALRALYGTEAGFTLLDLDRWYSFRERVGADIAAAVAWSGLAALTRLEGADRTQRFLQAVLAAPVTKDVRAFLHERSTPMGRLLSSNAGISQEEFWRGWSTELAAARRALASDLERLPNLRGDVEFLALSTESRRVRYRVQVAGKPPDTGRYSFLYHLLPPFDEEIAPASLQREQHRFGADSEAELPESFPRGSRLYWTFSMEEATLGCPVISGWRRTEVR